MSHTYRAVALALVAAATSISAAQAQTPESFDIRTGIYRGRPVTYQVINGLAIFEGDIILGLPEQLEPPSGQLIIKEPDTRKDAAVRSDTRFLWPDGIVPYTIDKNLADPQRVLDAIEHWSDNTVIEMLQRTNEPNWVHFVEEEELCASSVGRVGGEQRILLDDGCDVGAVIHEIGHTAGFWHEQSRADRDTFVSVLLENIDKRAAFNFDQAGQFGTDVGGYDYGSIMHYGAFFFSRNGRPTIETIPPGMVIGEAEGLSAGDIDGVSRLYGQAPTKTTISTNPAGLRIEVEGMTFTAPQSFEWAPRTSHTVRVPSPQEDDSQRFLFVKWSDGGSQSHNVRASSSATVFTAHFIEQFKIETSAVPPEGGTVTISPSSPDGFYITRTPVDVTADPAGGLSFERWRGRIFASLHGVSGNPAQFPVRSPGLNYTAVFTEAQLTTIATNAPGRRVVVDDDSVRAPMSFPWDAGSTHTIGVEDAVQRGPSGASRWVFREWSDGGALTHDITVPDEASTFAADFTTQYLLTTTVFPPNGGSIQAVPSSGDGFYDSDTPVELTAVPKLDFELGFWLGDVSGMENPQALIMNDQGWVSAVFLSDELMLGVGREFSLPSVSNPTFFSGPFGYRMVVPEGATRLVVSLATATAGANVDLYLQHGSEPTLFRGRIVADYSSTQFGGRELIVVTPTASPPLQAGTYFIALVLWTTGVEVTGTLTAKVTAPDANPPQIDVSVPAFTFTAEEGMNPSPQTFEIRNMGGETLNYQVATNQPWLSVSPEQGSSAGEADTIEVSVNIDGLQPGTHEGTITVSELQATKAAATIFQAAPVMISVTLVVSPAASGLSPGGIVNAASFNAFAAPASIMSLFGTGFTDRTEVANTTPLPTTLAGSSVTVTDSAGVPRTAELFFVSEGQINFLIPEGAALGRATVTVTREDGESGSIAIQLEAVGPALFSANADGMGVAAAVAVTAGADGSQTSQFVFQCGVTAGSCVASPLDLGSESDQVVLVLFGTGLRGRSDLSAVSATVGGEDVPVLFAGPQGGFVGLDQVNLGPLRRSLIGRGEVEIVLTVDGKVANTVTVSLR